MMIFEFANISTPIPTFPLVRGCCRFSGFTPTGGKNLCEATTAYPLRVQGGRSISSAPSQALPLAGGGLGWGLNRSSQRTTPYQAPTP